MERSVRTSYPASTTAYRRVHAPCSAASSHHPSPPPLLVLLPLLPVRSCIKEGGGATLSSMMFCTTPSEGGEKACGVGCL